jgi:hypothetical protein
VHGACVLALLAGAATAHADVINDKFDVSLGIFLLDTSTHLRVDGTDRLGTSINLEHDLGFSSKNSFRFDGYWRFATRHKIRLEYFENSRSASHTIDREIDIGDTTFPVDTSLYAQFKTVTIEGAYEYAFLRSDKYELAGSLGIHDMYFKLNASAVGNTINTSASAKADVNGPLPVIGLHWLWQFTPEWNLDVLAEFFGLKVNPYDGTLQNYNVSVAWVPSKHWGAGLGWNEFIFHAGVDGNSFNGNLSWRYGGLRAFVKFEY